MTITSLNALPTPASLPASRTVAATATAGMSSATSPAAPAAPSPSVHVTLSGATSATSATAPVIYSAQPPKAPAIWQDASVAIGTASGHSLTLTLQDDGSISVKAQDNASLSDDEQAAVAKLAVAFRDALNGLASAPPRLDLTGLAQVDTNVLSSVHLSAKATNSDQAIQTIDFTADATSRAVTIDGANGKVHISVDQGSPAMLGSKAQQATAIANDLKQIDQAAARGHADPALIALFKTAFTQLNAPAGIDATASTRPSSWLNETDHALLSGLADFSASITQTARASNPYRTNEHEAFSFQMAQTTQVSGRNAAERSISQSTSSQLHASFHSALSADARLNLSDDPTSQNYYYTQIDDTAQNNIAIGYRKGLLVQALSTATASQSTERSKYIMGQKVEDLTTPLKKSQQRDLLPVLTQMERHPPRTTEERDERSRALARIHDSLGLQTNPVALG